MGFISILSLLALLLVMLADRTYGKFFRYDYTYEADVHGWVKFHLMPETWEEARLRCFLEGSTLASPLNNKSLAVMIKYMGDKAKEIYTGISATHSSGDFYSVEGISLENINIPKLWACGEPDNKDGQENCITLDSKGSLADVNCMKAKPFMCVRKITPNIEFSKLCGTIDPDYLFETRTGHCYKVHRFGQSWSKAFKACSAEGGYLAIINSEVEAKAIHDLMDRYPENKIQAYHKNTFHIGFCDWSQHGVWMTVHGQTIAKAGYDHWKDGNPDNDAEGEYCGSMVRAGGLNDIGCNKDLPFICEMLPGSLLNKDTTEDL